LFRLFFAILLQSTSLSSDLARAFIAAEGVGMAQWIVCPSCNLRQSRRADGRCPRCRESVDRATTETVTAPPIVPGRDTPAATPLAPPPAAAAPPRPPTPRPVATFTPRPVQPRRQSAAAPLGSTDLDSTWLVRAVRTRAVRAFSTAVALLALGALFAAGQARYLRNFFGGPYAATAEDLAAIHDPDAAPHYFVHVEGTRAVELGLEVYEVRTQSGRETGRTLKARFYALQVGDRFLVVKAANASNLVVEGELRPVDGELESHLYSSADMRAVRNRFHPYFLDTQSFRSAGYWGLGLGSVFFAVFGFWAARAWKRVQGPANDALVERASAWGDPAVVSAEIEQERERPWLKVGGFEITERYVVKATFYGLTVLRLSDLLWAYKKVIKKSVNFVPVGKDYQAVLCCAGGTAEVQTKEDRVHEILQYAAARTPWALFGHTKELADAFAKDPAGFVAAVAERRRQFEAEQAQAATAS
jgi:hypothetical protein